jgi:hypothetical protein
MFDYNKPDENIISDHNKQLPLLVPRQIDLINWKLNISSDHIKCLNLYIYNKMKISLTIIQWKPA